MNTSSSSNSNESNRGATPFWLSRRGALVAVVILHIAALLVVLIEFFWPFPPDAHAVERVHALDFLASYAAYGFVACVILVLLGIVLRKIVMRGEDYYGGDDD